MSEKEAEQPIPRSLWHVMAGREVFVQLRDGVEYCTVTAPNQAVVKLQELDGTGKVLRQGYLTGAAAGRMTQQSLEEQQLMLQGLRVDEKPAAEDLRHIVTEPARSSVLMGKLRVHQDAYGAMLSLSFADPLDETGQAVVDVLVAPDLVAFMSSSRKPLIQT